MKFTRAARRLTGAARECSALLLLTLLATAALADSHAPLQHALNVDGHTLALWEKRARHAQGVVLLVHGRTWSSLPNFDLKSPGENRSVMDAFARAGFTAYALDLRGQGRSPRDPSGWLTPQRAANDVSAALDWIAHENAPLAGKITLLGYSRGAQVAVLVAQRHPAHLATLVLFGFPPGVRISAPADGGPPREPNTAKAAASDFITPGAAAQPVIDAYVAQALASDPVRVDWRDEQQFAFEPQKIVVPTLMIYGVNDPFRNAAAGEFFAALATTDRSFSVLPNSDHAAHVEDTGRAWIHAIVEFVRQPRPSN
ncbi:MAG: alpha/beta fold hydrolase [Pseudomonadota bacterium]